MKAKIFSLLLIFTALYSFAQQDSQFTQYMYNTITINPAYAGSRGAMSVFGMYRAQWVGLDGAPKTSAFSLHTPLNNNRLGIGVSIINDKIGPTNQTDIAADLSYTVPTSETFKLSFGIKASANIFNLDINKLNPADQNDPQFQNFDSDFKPNIGAGVYWHSDRFYLGLSVPNFIQTDHYSDNDVAIYTEKMNFYLISGYVFDLSREIKFKPAVLSKMVAGAPLQVDVSANFMFNEKFVLGMAYRWSAAFSAMAGFQISDGLYIGYAYDNETTDLNRYSYGSHEVFLRYDFIKNNSRMTTPRFF
ncbi:PorP/SprF family type IX secretion system membrane protein [Flavobacterium agrisoli]|uniref:Type IX secretion system membrane protein PorP/SprF n=1 Tax=Flavobacterium agrisoli TaxID=2793066 RepID=A0A934PL06_9FLAO|nr:type IX secretion system membrane protein PorP/SprF [Flavobacterium agrisoli]MBK0370106.1 type IX secretion system membrane protein PorP/SprF [Flavobacterium agrisoli]